MSTNATTAPEADDITPQDISAIRALAENARLIAAAPDLLATLEMIADDLEDHPAYLGKGLSYEALSEEGGDAGSITHWAYCAREAISNATGGSK